MAAILYGLLVNPVSAGTPPISHLDCSAPHSVGAVEANEAIIIGEIGATKQIGFVSDNNMETATYTSVVNTKKVIRSSSLEIPSTFGLQQKSMTWLPTNSPLSLSPIENGTALMVITKSPENGVYTLREYAECDRGR